MKNSTIEIIVTALITYDLIKSCAKILISAIIRTFIKNSNAGKKILNKIKKSVKEDQELFN